MKVAAFYGKGDVRIEDRPIPTPGPNQLVVKINYVGVCGTDVEFYKGGYPPSVHLPMVLGHENVGTVTAVGEGVTEYQVGDRILCLDLPLTVQRTVPPASGERPTSASTASPHSRHWRS